jgi:hypothetical protein
MQRQSAPHAGLIMKNNGQNSRGNAPLSGALFLVVLENTVILT